MITAAPAPSPRPRRRFTGMTRAGALALALLAATACEDQPTTSVVIRTGDVWSFVQAPMATGDGLYVAISGQPFGDLAPELETLVLTAMTEATTWTATPRYTTDRASAADTSVRVIVSFNGGERRPCGTDSPAPGGGPQVDGRVDVLFTLCTNDQIASQVSGHLTGADGSGDPKFTALIRQATRALLRSGQ